MRGLKCQKGRLGCLVMTLAGFIFYAFGVFYYSLLKEAPSVWHIVCEEDSGQTEEDYERVMKTWEKDRQEKDFPLACAFWKKEEGQTAENLSLNRTCDVTVWKVRGSLEVLVQSSAVLNEDDWQGCYLAEDTAWELFGSTEAAGNEIVCGQRRLTVRGVLKDETSLLVMRPETKETTDRIALGMTLAAHVKGFLMSYGLRGKPMSSGFLAEIAQWLLLLYPGVLAAGFLKSLKKDYPVWAAGKILWWIMLAAMAYLLFRNIKIPETMIPGKWSDFQFWKDWWKSFQEQIVCFVQMDKTKRELRQAGIFMKSAVCSAMPFLITALKKEVCQ